MSGCIPFQARRQGAHQELGGDGGDEAGAAEHVIGGLQEARHGGEPAQMMHELANLPKSQWVAQVSYTLAAAGTSAIRQVQPDTV